MNSIPATEAFHAKPDYIMCFPAWKKLFCRQTGFPSGSGSYNTSPVKVNTSEDELRRGSTSFWSSVYDRTVRTDSYNEFAIRMEVFSVEFQEVCPEIDRLLEPNQETVESVLQQSLSAGELPEIVEMAKNYFLNSRNTSRLCGSLLKSINEAREQSRLMETVLSGTSSKSSADTRQGSGLSLDLSQIQQREIVDGLKKMIDARNPFAGMETSRMFDEVKQSYGVLSSSVEEKRKFMKKKMKDIKRFKGGGVIAVVVLVLAGIAFAVVLVATHAVASVALAPMAVAVTTVGSGNLKQGRKLGFLRRHGFCEQKLKQGVLKKQISKLEALARGNFTVNRMLDTLRCLVLGLRDDMERNRRLMEFGWRHGDEALCVQQVARQLHRSHGHLNQQLDNLQEQLVVCFLIINKARDWVFQEFSPSSSRNSPSR